jgi:hypothetical protein
MFETREQWMFWYGYEFGLTGDQFPVIKNDLTWLGWSLGLTERKRRLKAFKRASRLKRFKKLSGGGSRQFRHSTSNEFKSDESIQFENEAKNFVQQELIPVADVDAAIILKRTLALLYEGKIHAKNNPALADDEATYADVTFQIN